MHDHPILPTLVTPYPTPTPTVADFARIRIGTSRVVSDWGAIITVSKVDSDEVGLFFKGVCQEHAYAGCPIPLGTLCGVRMLSVAEVRP
jgi:hypothetical protein